MGFNTNQLKVNIPNNSYTITIGKNLLKDVDKYFNVNRKILIVKDHLVYLNRVNMNSIVFGKYCK